MFLVFLVFQERSPQLELESQKVQLSLEYQAIQEKLAQLQHRVTSLVSESTFFFVSSIATSFQSLSFFTATMSEVQQEYLEKDLQLQMVHNERTGLQAAAQRNREMTERVLALAQGAIQSGALARNLLIELLATTMGLQLPKTLAAPSNLSVKPVKMEVDMEEDSVPTSRASSPAPRRGSMVEHAPKRSSPYLLRSRAAALPEDQEAKPPAAPVSLSHRRRSGIPLPVKTITVAEDQIQMLPPLGPARRTTLSRKDLGPSPSMADKENLVGKAVAVNSGEGNRRRSLIPLRTR